LFDTQPAIAYISYINNAKRNNEMSNKLELLDIVQGWTAIFSGETGIGESVIEQEGHNIAGDNDEERVQNALVIWGADATGTRVTITLGSKAPTTQRSERHDKS
jgi:hypothetical protein